MQNGRIKDYPKQEDIPGRFSNVKLWTAFESICEVLGESKSARIVFSNNQNVSITNVPRELTHRVEYVLDKCNVKWKDLHKTYSPLMMNAMACVAFPTCGLAMAPAETYVPTLLSKLDTIMDELDFKTEDRDIVLRMSGCPNGCSRPYVAEIALVGRSFSEERGGIYDLFLGGLPSGERLATRYRTGLDETQILKAMRPILRNWKTWKHKNPKSCFGDFVVDTKIVDPCMAGPTYERINQRRPGVTFWPRKDEEVRKYLKLMYEENRDGIRDVVRSNYSDGIAKEYERELMSLEF
jgi:sulfite reductase (NADPH) hemoprotein beta-component